MAPTSAPVFLPTMANVAALKTDQITSLRLGELVAQIETGWEEMNRRIITAVRRLQVAQQAFAARVLATVPA